MRRFTNIGLIAAATGVLGMVACGGDDDDDDGPSAGNGGTTAGRGGGGSGGTGAASGGKTTGGTTAGGTTTTGGTTTAAGETNGGTTTTGGTTTGGTSGTSGTSGQSGGGQGGAGEGGGGTGADGGGGDGGSGGEPPGEPLPDTAVYNFETGTQGWSGGADVTLATSTEQSFAGTQSLKITFPEIANPTRFNVGISVQKPQFWPQTVLTFHAWLPTGLDASDVYVQAFTQGNLYRGATNFDTAGNVGAVSVTGQWMTWTYTVPNGFPGGLQALGFQLGDNGGASIIPAGTAVYMDSIRASGGTMSCAGVGTGAHGFETTPLDTGVYQRDGSDTDWTMAQSTDLALTGTGSLKVTFTNLPAPATGQITERRLLIAGPDVYCGQQVTFHVRMPAASTGLAFQGWTHYNNFDGFSRGTAPIITPDAWNTYVYTVPADVGPGGIQRVGLEFAYTGTTPFSGDVYIDDITWGPAAP